MSDMATRRPSCVTVCATLPTIYGPMAGPSGAFIVRNMCMKSGLWDVGVFIGLCENFGVDRGWFCFYDGMRYVLKCLLL